MQKSVSTSYKELPTWLHTLLLFVIFSPFLGCLFWVGIKTIMTATLMPLNGLDLGHLFFGVSTLSGIEAKVAGFSLLSFGCSFLAVAFQLSRFASGSKISLILPLVVFAISEILSILVQSTI